MRISSRRHSCTVKHRHPRMVTRGCSDGERCRCSQSQHHFRHRRVVGPGPRVLFMGTHGWTRSSMVQDHSEIRAYSDALSFLPLRHYQLSGSSWTFAEDSTRSMPLADVLGLTTVRVNRTSTDCANRGSSSSNGAACRQSKPSAYKPSPTRNSPAISRTIDHRSALTFIGMANTAL